MAVTYLSETEISVLELSYTPVELLGFVPEDLRVRMVALGRSISGLVYQDRTRALLRVALRLPDGPEAAMARVHALCAHNWRQLYPSDLPDKEYWLDYKAWETFGRHELMRTILTESWGCARLHETAYPEYKPEIYTRVYDQYLSASAQHIATNYGIFDAVWELLRIFEHVTPDDIQKYAVTAVRESTPCA